MKIAHIREAWELGEDMRSFSRHSELCSNITRKGRPMAERLDHPGSLSERSAADGKARAVHPKWLSVDTCADEEALDHRDMARFRTFMQLLKTAGAMDRAAAHALGDLDLTAGAFAALLELDAHGDPGLAPSELARRLAVARRTATLYVDILSRHGWVERQPHPEDRRMVLARLTEDGEMLLENHVAAYKQRLAGLLSDLSPLQAERLRQLLTLVDTSVTAESEARCQDVSRHSEE
jgi:DNA-binding MarR family transcriptional regulator